MTALAMQQMNQHNRQTNAGLKELKELSTVYKLVKRSNKVDQDLAIGLESQYPGIIRSRVAIGSFTDKPSERNVSITLEAVMETIKNAIKKIFESISNAIKKFKDWIMGIVNYFKKGEGSEPTVAEKAAEKDSKWSDSAIKLSNELLEDAFPKYKEKASAEDKQLSDKELKDKMYSIVDDSTKTFAINLKACMFILDDNHDVKKDYDPKLVCYETVLGSDKRLSALAGELNKTMDRLSAVGESDYGGLKLDDFTVSITDIVNTTGTRMLFNKYATSEEKEAAAKDEHGTIKITALLATTASKFAGESTTLNNEKLLKEKEITPEFLRDPENLVYKLCNGADSVVKNRKLIIDDLSGVTGLLPALDKKVISLGKKIEGFGDDFAGVDSIRKLIGHYNNIISFIRSFTAALGGLLKAIKTNFNGFSKLHLKRLTKVAAVLKVCEMEKEIDQMDSLAIIKATGKPASALLENVKGKASTESDGVDYDDLSHAVPIQDEDDLAMALDAANEPSEAEYSDGI